MSAPATPCRVMAFDDHMLVLQGLVALLDLEPNIQVVATAQSGDRASELVRQARPDVVLLDLRMPGPSSVEVIRSIKSETPNTRVIALTALDTDDKLMESFAAGADGYVLKGAEKSDLLNAIAAVMRGQKWVHPSLGARLLRQHQGTSSADSDLSARDVHILKLISHGHSNRQIAHELAVSERTVKSYTCRIFQKLMVVDRAQAVSEAMRRGLID